MLPCTGLRRTRLVRRPLEAPRPTRNRSREGQPCPVVAAVAAPVGRHRCQPRLQRPAPGPPLL